MKVRVLKRLCKDGSGATAIEYGLMVGLLALAAIGALNGFADETTAMFNHVGSSVKEVTSG